MSWIWLPLLGKAILAGRIKGQPKKGTDRSGKPYSMLIFNLDVAEGLGLVACRGIYCPTHEEAAAMARDRARGEPDLEPT